MSKRWVPVLIAVVFFVIAILIMYDQKLSINLWFQIRDIHHETFAIAAVAIGIGVLIGSVVTETKSHINCRVL